MIRDKCSICNSNMNNIFSLNNMPVKMSCISLPIIDHNNLSISKCINCKTIQLDQLIPLNVLYSDSHNYTSIGKTWGGYFNLFLNKIETIIKNKNILEIGDPSGKIANIAQNYNKWYIVEPNKNKNIIFNKNIEFIEGYFDDNFQTKEKIDVIIHSHLFEHIYQPNLFLKKCNNLLDINGEMFFGVPNMQYIAEQYLCPFLGIFFEHTIFLNKENITYLLQENMFEILEIIDYENHSTLYHVKKITHKLPNKINFNFDHYTHLFFNSLEKYKYFIQNCNQKLSTLLSKNVYIFGASYNTQYLLALGLDQKNIHGIIDNCIEKQGKYLYGTELKIYNPNILIEKNCVVILKNGCYVNEITTQILSLNSNTLILT